MAQLPFET